MAKDSGIRKRMDVVKLVVVDSKTNCPDCGRLVRVNHRREMLYSHSRMGSAENCIVRTPHIFVFESIAPLLKPPPADSRKVSVTENRLPVEIEYPAETKHSVRAKFGGLPGHGRNRRH